jgi:hypothetical protein
MLSKIASLPKALEHDEEQGSWGIAQHILNLCSGWRWIVSSTPWWKNSLYPLERRLAESHSWSCLCRKSSRVSAPRSNELLDLDVSYSHNGGYEVNCFLGCDVALAFTRRLPRFEDSRNVDIWAMESEVVWSSTKLHGVTSQKVECCTEIVRIFT